MLVCLCSHLQIFFLLESISLILNFPHKPRLCNRMLQCVVPSLFLQPPPSHIGSHFTCSPLQRSTMPHSTISCHVMASLMRKTISSPMINMRLSLLRRSRFRFGSLTKFGCKEPRDMFAGSSCSSDAL